MLASDPILNFRLNRLSLIDPFAIRFRTIINNEFVSELRKKVESLKHKKKSTKIKNLTTIFNLYVIFKKQKSNADNDIKDLLSNFEEDIIVKTRKMLVEYYDEIQGIHLELDSLMQYANQDKHSDSSYLLSSNTSFVQDIEYRQIRSEKSDNAMLCKAPEPNINKLIK
jgi:predicted component of viral defense system (DUF524 family)